MKIMKIKLIITLIAALLSGVSFSQGIAQKSASNVVFESGFEEGYIWDNYNVPDYENMLLSDPGPFNKTNNHVVRLAVTSGERGGSGLVKVLPEQYDSLYVKWYLKYEKGFNFNAGNHGSALFAGNRNYLGMSGNRPAGDDFASSGIEYNPKTHRSQLYVYSRGMYQDCADPQGSCWGDVLPCTSDEGKTYCKHEEDRDPPLPPVLTDDKWYCFEMKVSMGKPSADGTGADGEIAFWLDGINYGHWKHRWMRTTDQLNLNLLWLNLFHHDGTHSDAGVLIDDVTVSKSRDVSTGLPNIKGTGDLLKIYPNPTDNSIKIYLPENPDCLAMLYDMTGRLLVTESITGNEGRINIEKFNPGIYNLIIKDNQNHALVTTRKLICR
jgi:hypothetical protein